MKRICSHLLSLVLALALVVGLTAGPGHGGRASAAGAISVYVDGVPLVMDQPPVATNNRVLVPVRAIFEALGATVTWSDPIVYSVRGDVSIAMMLGENVMTKDSPEGSELITLDVAPIAMNNRILVPVRAVSEAFDCQVTWDGAANRVDVYTAADYSQDDRVYYNANYSHNVTYRNAIYEGDTLYFTFLRQPELYVYDGTSVRTFPTGTFPRNLVVRDGIVYYYSQGDRTVYALDTADGSREVLFNVDGAVEIDDMLLYRNYLLVANYGGDGVYSINVDTGESVLLYDPPALCSQISITAAAGKVYLMSRLYEDGVWSCTLLSADPDAGGSQVLYTGLATVLFCATDGSGVYFYDPAASDDEANTYYFMDAATDQRTVVPQPTYRDAYQAYRRANDSTWQDDWTFTSGTETGVFRESRTSDLTETLYRGEGCGLLTNNQSQVAFLQTESGFTAGSGSWGATSVYVMNVDGSGLREIINNGEPSNQGTNPGTTDPGGGLTPVTCRICHGTGEVVCSYCHGLGFSFGEVCPLCKGAAKQTCAGCGGFGILYPQT